MSPREALDELAQIEALLVPYWQQIADADSEAREEYERGEMETAASEAWERQQEEAAHKR